MDNTQGLKDEIEKGLKDQAWIYGTLFFALVEEKLPPSVAAEITAAYAQGTTSKLGALMNRRR